MEKTASQIQKERIKELEAKADALIAKCDVATLTSINEKCYHSKTVYQDIGSCWTGKTAVHTKDNRSSAGC